MPAIKQLDDDLEEEFTEEEFEEFFGEALRQEATGQGSDGFEFLNQLKEKYIQQAKERGFL
jgi:hypothetical protein